MKAMILAAGLGTRLRPLTDRKPKALVEVSGISMLEIVIRKLQHFGVNQIIINVHHFPEMIEDFLKSRGNLGLCIELSLESKILGTGGGLRKAAWFFDDEHSFFLHNVDVISEIDLLEMLKFHRTNKALATLAVQNRSTRRSIIVDEENRFCGRHEAPLACKPFGRPRKIAFNGIQVISPALLPRMTERDPFSIIDTYIRLASQGEDILCFDIGNVRWWDLGNPDSLAQAQLEYQWA